MLQTKFCVPNPIDYGWMKKDVLKSGWFKGPQLHQACRETKKEKDKRGRSSKGV